MKSAGKARNNGLYRHIRTSKEIIRNLLNDSLKSKDPIQQYISWQNPTRESDLADARRPPVQLCCIKTAQ